MYFKTNARFGTAMFAGPFVSSQKVNDVCLPCQSRLSRCYGSVLLQFYVRRCRSGTPPSSTTRALCPPTSQKVAA